MAAAEKIFVSALEANIEKCVGFYRKQLEQFSNDQQILVKKLQNVEKQVKGATSRREAKRLIRELYRGLRLLKNFHALNYIAVVKILKKHHKLSAWKELDSIMMQRLGNTDYYPEVADLDVLIHAVEKQFSEFVGVQGHSDMVDELRRSTRSFLKHRYTFIAGTNLGVSFAAVAVPTILLILVETLTPVTWNQIYVGKINFLPRFLAAIPVYRSVLFLQLHFLFWGIDTVFFDKLKLSVCFITNSSTASFLRWNRILFVQISFRRCLCV